jgi:beta-barrel assembly-enhancing protease
MKTSISKYQTTKRTTAKKAKASPPKHNKTGYLSKLTLFAAILICIFITPSYAYDLPDLGNRSTTIASEKELGTQFVREVGKNFVIFDDILVNGYIKTLGDRLVAHSKSPTRKFHFFIVQDQTINAFTGPNNYVGINTGLISSTNTESELASVLAHEISHATQRHILRGIEQQKEAMLPEIAAIAAAIALSTKASSDSASTAAGSAAMATMAGSTQYAINSIRGYEQEADRIGMQTLYNAGFDPFGMPNFFERMQRQSGSYTEEIPSFLQDHPVTAERIADSRNRASQYPKRTIHASDDYYLIKVRLQTLLNKNYQNIYYYQDGLKNKNPTLRDTAQYGYALMLLNNFQLSAAEENIKELISRHPEQNIYEITLADIKIAAKKNDDAVAILQKTLSRNPNDYPLAMEYAEALMNAKKYTNAESFLLAQSEKYPQDPDVYEKLAQAQARNGHLASAYRSRAKMFELYGYDKAAALQLEQAKRMIND